MYICKLASIEEMHTKWDYEIRIHPQNRAAWVIWKDRYIGHRMRGDSLPYYGILDGEIICEATALLRPEIVQNSEGLVDSGTVYLSAFRTVEAYRGQGYFSKLFRYMLQDLRERGYTKVTLGVEPHEEQNRRIYEHFGFTEFIKSSTESYPDGSVVTVDYYARRL